ncbi:MAG TPA: AraC family transcriptional regulator [Lacibacter sp.]|nr:AraC family transcriptional regulator [Lacibacter sp.]HMO89876.1 AraC family transcriptional regulator [Lacibacter sp.]HMP87718.1 AraC family transcriptional regulator [Lacibacter sp.]
MKARLEQTGFVPGSKALFCFEINLPCFELFWHHHPEYELTYIEQGSGRRLAGDSLLPFTSGDLVFSGPHLPHSWVSDPVSTGQVKATVLHLSPAYLQTLLDYPGTGAFQQLLQSSRQGLVFSGHTDQVPYLMKALINAQALNQLSLLVQLLHILTELPFQPLASAVYQLPQGNLLAASRLNQALQLIHSSFTSSRVTSAVLADSLHMSESAFCKFFKRNTGKTLSSYVNELRIAQACRLLVETDQTVEQTAFASGFESLSYFNRVFLRKKEVQPTRYRKGYRENYPSAGTPVPQDHLRPVNHPDCVRISKKIQSVVDS